MMTVYLVMGGTTPEGVFDTLEKAQNFISDRCAFSGLPLSYYRTVAFELK